MPRHAEGVPAAPMGAYPIRNGAGALHRIREASGWLETLWHQQPMLVAPAPLGGAFRQPWAAQGLAARHPLAECPPGCWISGRWWWGPQPGLTCRTWHTPVPQHRLLRPALGPHRGLPGAPMRRDRATRRGSSGIMAVDKPPAATATCTGAGRTNSPPRLPLVAAVTDAIAAPTMPMHRSARQS